MRHVITSFCNAGYQTRAWLGPALHGVNAHDEATFQHIMDETVGIAPSDIPVVVQILTPELQRFARGMSEADLCVSLIDETALHELDMAPAYRFVANVCRQDQSDLLRSSVLSQLPEERATAVNNMIAELSGRPALPLPRRQPNLWAVLALGIAVSTAAEVHAAAT